jgi:hypothetical protein
MQSADIGKLHRSFAAKNAAQDDKAVLAATNLSKSSATALR